MSILDDLKKIGAIGKLTESDTAGVSAGNERDMPNAGQDLPKYGAPSQADPDETDNEGEAEVEESALVVAMGAMEEDLKHLQEGLNSLVQQIGKFKSALGAVKILPEAQ